MKPSVINAIIDPNTKTSNGDVVISGNKMGNDCYIKQYKN